MSAPLTGPTSGNTPPWWAHLLIGVVVLAAGVILALVGTNGTTMAMGLTAVGAGLSFLGVGAGVAAAT